MTIQDITMGYERKTGRRIMLSEHEKTFAEFLEYYDIRRPGWDILIAERGHAGAWKKADQIGYYRALQDDWEAARDDEIDPPVVDLWEELPETARKISTAHRAAYSQIAGLARLGRSIDARNIYDASTLTYAEYMDALDAGEKQKRTSNVAQ